MQVEVVLARDLELHDQPFRLFYESLLDRVDLVNNVVLDHDFVLKELPDCIRILLQFVDAIRVVLNRLFKHLLAAHLVAFPAI